MTGELDLTGLWNRERLEWPGQAPDVTTAVHWLQGPGYYIDLRQPKGRPDFSAVSCLRDLRPVHLDWMARQDGFAGLLSFDGAYYSWGRDLDIQPPGEFPDSGRLWFEDGLLKEEGRHVPYLEHWRRAPSAPGPAAAMRLHDGVPAFVVRVGDLFMYARARPHRGEAADCEISFGRIGAAWVIERSSLPYREGKALEVALTGGEAVVSDVTPEGRPIRRAWTVADLRGPASALVSS